MSQRQANVCLSGPAKIVRRGILHEPPAGAGGCKALKSTSWTGVPRGNSHKECVSENTRNLFNDGESPEIAGNFHIGFVISENAFLITASGNHQVSDWFSRICLRV